MKKLPAKITQTILASLLLTSAAAWSQSPAPSAAAAAAAATTTAPAPELPLHTRATAAACANCHGTEGRAVQGSSIPGSLANMPKEYFLTTMQAFRSGARPATVMHQLSKGLTDAQIESLATYFSSQSR